mgnify:CR=1 FL=1
MIRLFVTGGTFDKRYNELTGTLTVFAAASLLVEGFERTDFFTGIDFLLRGHRLRGDAGISSGAADSAEAAPPATGGGASVT